MIAHGQIEPIAVIAQEQRYVVIDGFCRVSIARSLGWIDIKAEIYPGMGDADARKVAFQRNVLRTNLSAAERANAMLLLRRDHGFTNPEIAHLFGTSPRTVRRYLELPEQILELIDGRTVTMAHGKTLADFAKTWDGILDATMLQALGAQIKDEHLSQATLKARLRSLSGTPSAGRSKTFAQVTKHRVRCRGFDVTPASDPEVLRNLSKSLEDALAHIARFLSAPPRKP